MTVAAHVVIETIDLIIAVAQVVLLAGIFVDVSIHSTPTVTRTLMLIGHPSCSHKI